MGSSTMYIILFLLTIGLAYMMWPKRIDNQETQQWLKSENERLEQAHCKETLERKNEELERAHKELREIKLMHRNYKRHDDDGTQNEFQWTILSKQQNLYIIESDSWFTIFPDLKFKPRLERQKDAQNFVHIKLRFNTDEGSLPYLHSRKYILVDQSDAKDKKDIELIDIPNFSKDVASEMTKESFFSSAYFFPSRIFEGPNRYFQNDKLLINVITEPLYLYFEKVESNNGTLLWQIDNYEEKKQEAIDGIKPFLISPPFKTREPGYTVQAALFLNGYGEAKGSQISMYIRFVMGEWDEYLPYPFKFKCSFQILDQLDSQVKENMSKNLTQQEFSEEKDNTYGFTFFALQSLAQSSKYLKNDQLLVKIDVEIL